MLPKMKRLPKFPARSTVLPKGRLAVGERPRMMGILNVTPDSFSDGGQYPTPSAAIDRAVRMVEEGADLIDVGGESTRPGAEPISLAEESDRVLPVIEGIARSVSVPISIDTQRAAVARAALAAGASIVNDVSAIRADPDMPSTIAEAGAAVVLMHMLGEPRTMQNDPVYDNVVQTVFDFLAERIAAACAAGIAPDRIVVDPGIGFGKTLEHNLALMANLGALRALGCPLLVGPSQKSFIGQILDLPVDQREEGTAAAVALATGAGADIIRVHDVLEMARVVRVAWAIVQAQADH